MKDNNDIYIHDEVEGELDFLELFRVLLNGKWIVGSFTLVFSIIAIFYSLSLPNIYQSEALLVPNESNNEFNALQGYSGLASVAGLNLRSQTSESNSMKAINKLNSLSFFEKNFLPNIFLPDLMALESWDPKSNSLQYDQSIFNSKENSWVREYSYPKRLIPSAQESFDIFRNKHLTIIEDKKSGLVTIKIKHQSPHIAMEWSKIIFSEINSFYRLKDKKEAKKAVSYLNEQISRTKYSEIKQVIASLLQQETQKLTLIEANLDYVYEYIDPPSIMERKSEPRRSLICIFGAFLGIFAGILAALIQHYLLRKN